jgi:hypothetical protein
MWAWRTSLTFAALASTPLIGCGCGPKIVEEIVASGDVSCLRVDRQMECWGGSKSATPAGLQVDDVTGICTGGGFACGRREDGRVLCGPAAPGTELVRVPGILRATVLSCGAAGGCFIDFEGVSCWDWSADGVGEINRVPGLSGVRDVGVGASHRCAALESGTLWCWGDNDKGQLGTDPAQLRSSVEPVQVASAANVTRVAAGGEHTCVLAAGQVQCFGANEVGQLGRSGGTSPLPLPVDVLPHSVEVASGLRHSCATTVDGEVYCWGWNRSGQLGDGTSDDRSLATRVPGLDGVIDLALGDEHSCALPDGGTPSCWGRNLQGQLGDGTFDDRPTPAEVHRAAE